MTLPIKALVPAVVRDFRLMSWTHLGMYDFILIEFIAARNITNLDHLRARRRDRVAA